MARVYKVVKTIGERHFSAVVGYYDPNLQLEYLVGKPVKPEVGNCFAFDDLEHAKSWYRTLSDGEIFLAEAGSAHPITTWIPRLINSSTMKEDIKLWWSGMWKKVTGWQTAPAGTVSCNWIMLKEKVS